MPVTTEALIIALIFLAPGLLYDYGLTRKAPYRRPDTGERLWRAFANSLILQAAILPLTFLLWRRYAWMDLSHASMSSVAWLLALGGAYVVAPFLAGSWRGWRLRGRVSETPSGWDHAFRYFAEGGYVRARLRSGEWVAGLYAQVEGRPPPFASGYPNEGALYLPVQIAVDPVTGSPLTDAEGQTVVRDWALLLKAAECERVEFQALPR